VQISPSFSSTHLILAAALAKLGEIDKAKATAARVLQLQPDFRLGRHFAGADYTREMRSKLVATRRMAIAKSNIIAHVRAARRPVATLHTTA